MRRVLRFPQMCSVFEKQLALSAVCVRANFHNKKGSHHLRLYCEYSRNAIRSVRRVLRRANCFWAITHEFLIKGPSFYRKARRSGPRGRKPFDPKRFRGVFTARLWIRNTYSLTSARLPRSILIYERESTRTKMIRSRYVLFASGERGVHVIRTSLGTSIRGGFFVSALPT